VGNNKFCLEIKICLNETHSKVHTGKYLYHSFHIQNGLKQGDALSQLLSNFALEYAGNQAGLKLNRAHQLLVYAGDVNLLGDNRDTINKNIETLTDASKEVGLKVNIKETTYVLMYHHENAGQDQDIKTARRSFENAPEFRYYGMAVINENCI
jgi:retron-type reverse transcriptase